VYDLIWIDELWGKVLFVFLGYLYECEVLFEDGMCVMVEGLIGGVGLIVNGL